jgi:hypothetical protein
VIRLVAVDLLVAALGLGLLPLLGAARSWAELAARCGLAPLVGLAATGVAGALLPLAKVTVGPVAVGAAAAVALGLAARRLRGTAWRPPRPSPLAVAGGLAVLGFAALAVPAFRVTPFDEYDAWAIWALKARALHLLGGADADVFAAPAYAVAHLEYPLLLPAVEAVGLGAYGLDPRLTVFQFLPLGLAGVAALATLLAGRVPPIALWTTLLAVVTAPAFLGQLLDAYADVPLALLVAAALTAGCRWALEREPWALRCAVLFLAAAALTKNEGLLYAAAVVLALLVVAAGARRRLLVASALVLVTLVPWRVFTALHDLHGGDYRLSDSLDPGWVAGRAGRGPLAVERLLSELLDASRWSLLLPLAVAALSAGLLLGARRVPLAAAVFFAVSLGCLGWVYLVSPLPLENYLDSSAPRVVSSLALATVACSPLALTEGRSRRAIRTA